MTEEIARAALRAYDVDVAACTFAAEAFNTVFRVEATDGSQYALRVGSALRIHADGCEELEAAWVNTLHAEGYPVVRVVPARDGSYVVDLGARRCVLFDWVRGRRLRDDPRPELVHAAGALTARLHKQGARYLREPPAGALAGNRVLSFRISNRLDELRPRFGTAIADAVGRAQASLDALWREPPHAPHLLHGDVNLGNVLVESDRITLIDFQDLFWGFEIQDVVIATVSLPHGDMFRSGYESVRPWPDADAATVAALEVARRLDILNYALARGHGLDEFVGRHAQPVVAWMTDG